MLKATLITFVMWGTYSHAAITDLFECKTEITDLQTKQSVQSVGMASGVRTAVSTNESTGLPYPPDQDVRMGEAKLSLSLNSGDHFYRVDFNLHYGIAKRPVDNPTEAREEICNQVSIQSCRIGHSCTAASDLCVYNPDPFAEIYGWSLTSLAPNGIPIFNEQLLRPLDTIIPADENTPNGAHATVNCKFKGTYF